MRRRIDLDNERRRVRGRDAIAVATPGEDAEPVYSRAVDTIANVLHALGDNDLAEHAVRAAYHHFAAERAMAR